MRFNNLVLRLIEGDTHRLLPRGLTKISYTGPISGNTICLPAISVTEGSRFLVVAGRHERKRWWRSFRAPHPARLVRDGHRYDVIGHVLAAAEQPGALETYLVSHPGSRRGIGADTPVVAFQQVDLCPSSASHP